MKTRLTELLNITYPVFQGSMAWVSEARLASAVSEAGGAGIIGTGGREADWVRNQIRLAKQLTDKPFGVNITLLDKSKDALMEVVCQEKVAFVTLGAGNPIPYFPILNKAGIKKIPVVPNVKLAKRVEEHGADAIVIEGMEAGGHIGSLTTMALLTQVIPAVKLPVIAAGGIADGRGAAAAFIMGADGVQIGTRFMIAEECAVHPNCKQKLIEAVDTDSVVTGLTSGHAVRGLRNEFTETFLAMERQCVTAAELNRFATGTGRKALVEGDVVNGMVQAGQSLLPLTSIEPAKVILETIMADMRQRLIAAPGLLNKQ